MYTWVAFYKEMAKWVLQYRNRQKELCDLLRKIGITSNLEDKGKEGKKPMEVMDPFTFFASFQKFKDSNKRAVYLKKLKEEAGLSTPMPDDYNGQPSAQPMKLWYFPSESKRKGGELDSLWDLAEQAVNGNLKSDTFQKVLSYPGIQIAKLTQGLFWLNPEAFYPIDAHKKYLEKKNINIKISNLNDYLETLKEIKERIGKPFYEISHLAWQSSQTNGETPKPHSTPLNQILYGPPGTGKTYKTINKALEIIISDYSSNELITYRSSNGTEESIYVSALYEIFISDEESTEKREVLTDIFKKFKDEGKIEFVTFHQSFSYEDFVEGIRPVLPDEEGTVDVEEEETLVNIKSETIRYKLKEGIFKRISLKARGVQGTVKEAKDVSFDNVNFYKMSLGGKLKPHIHKWCIENSKVSIGWGRDHDFKDFLDIKNSWDLFSKKFKKDLKELVDDSSYHIQAMYTFLNMKKGDIVVASKGNKIIDAIGVISSDKYHFKTEEGIHYKQFRDIEWLAIDMNASPELFFKKNISQQTIYQFYDDYVKKDEFKKLLQKDKSKIGNYVLIIDEINRGNVASIFGELITLIEPDKRLGAANELSLRLPYSNENDEAFGVPANLYIIGTMNTADRSIEALDTALRRRFSFEFMEPNSGLVPELEEYGINLREIFIAINKRITYLLDGDHQIGHSYFMGIKDEEGLKCAFKDKIIPLLKEYFFNDYGKIRLVLGDGFVKKFNKPKFAINDDELDNDLYEIMPIDDNFQIIEALKKTT